MKVELGNIQLNPGQEQSRVPRSPSSRAFGVSRHRGSFDHFSSEDKSHLLEQKNEQLMHLHGKIKRQKYIFTLTVLSLMLLVSIIGLAIDFPFGGWF